MTTKPRKLPDYDPERDGHVFRWILRAAQHVREQQQSRLAREYVHVLKRHRKHLPKVQVDDR